MRYNLIIEAQINRLSSLQKVRIKTDPKYLAKENMPDKCPAYEGYILEEGLSKVKVLILPPDMSIEEVPIELIEYISAEDKDDVFNDLKRFIISSLNIKENDPLEAHIINSCDLNELETYIKQAGVVEGDINKLYGEFIIT